jgi:hypothetical protein
MLFLFIFLNLRLFFVLFVFLLDFRCFFFHFDRRRRRRCCTDVRATTSGIDNNRICFSVFRCTFRWTRLQ